MKLSSQLSLLTCISIFFGIISYIPLNDKYYIKKNKTKIRLGMFANRPSESNIIPASNGVSQNKENSNDEKTQDKIETNALSAQFTDRVLEFQQKLYEFSTLKHPLNLLSKIENKKIEFFGSTYPAKDLWEILSNGLLVSALAHEKGKYCDSMGEITTLLKLFLLKISELEESNYCFKTIIGHKLDFNDADTRGMRKLKDIFENISVWGSKFQREYPNEYSELHEKLESENDCNHEFEFQGYLDQSKKIFDKLSMHIKQHPNKLAEPHYLYLLQRLSNSATIIAFVSINPIITCAGCNNKNKIREIFTKQMNESLEIELTDAKKFLQNWFPTP